MEPNVSERTIKEWWGWVAPTSLEEEARYLGYVTPEIHREKWYIDLRSPNWKSPESLIDEVKKHDWVINDGTYLLFDEDHLIGPDGWEQMIVLTPDKAADAITRGGQLVNVHTGSGVAPGRTVVALERDALGQADLVQEAGGLNVVGISGFNSAQAQNFNALNRSDFSTVNLSSQLIRREGQEELK